MNGYIDKNGNYYEADKNITGAVEVPLCPSADHVWHDGAWVYVQPLPPPPPTEVTMRQARLAMLDAGILSSVDSAVAGMTGTAGEAAKIEWEYAQTLKRDHPLVVSLSTALNLTPAQLDALFTAAGAK